MKARPKIGGNVEIFPGAVGGVFLYPFKPPRRTNEREKGGGENVEGYTPIDVNVLHVPYDQLLKASERSNSEERGLDDIGN